MKHVIYYYPYSYLDREAAWLLQATALYFDELVMLDWTESFRNLQSTGPIARKARALPSRESRRKTLTTRTHSSRMDRTTETSTCHYMWEPRSS